MTRSVRGSAAALAALGCAAALVVSGCTSSGRAASEQPPASGPASVSAPASPSASASASESTPGSASSATQAAAARSSSGAGRVLVADPAEYHVGSVGPDSPVTRDLDQVSFQTPSRNIRCTVIGSEEDLDEVTCEIGRHSFAAAPRPSSCDHNWLGSDVRLAVTGATLGVCAGDPQVLQNSTVLPYGYRLTTGRITCTSTSAALACSLSGSTHGFTLDVAGARLRWRPAS